MSRVPALNEGGLQDIKMVGALFLDLDDTIFPTRSIAPGVFEPLFSGVRFEAYYSREEVLAIRNDLWEKPMAEVARHYKFPNELVEQYHRLAGELVLDMDIRPYPDYPYLLNIPLPKYLVTTGTTPVQLQKIRALSIGDHFDRIVINDPVFINGGKKACFRQLLQEIKIGKKNVLVIGDNTDSEIRAARELGLPWFHMDRSADSPDYQNHTITSFRDLSDWYNSVTGK